MLKPINGRVVVSPEKKKPKISRLGIILPEDKEVPVVGIVVSSDGNLVKTGDRVLFSKFGYDEVDVGGETLFLVSEHNILCIMT